MSKFEISYSRTVNLGNYESHRLEYKKEFEGDDGENIALSEVFSFVDCSLKDLTEAIKQRNKQ